MTPYWSKKGVFNHNCFNMIDIKKLACFNFILLRDNLSFMLFSLAEESEIVIGTIFDSSFSFVLFIIKELFSCPCSLWGLTFSRKLLKGFGCFLPQNIILMFDILDILSFLSEEVELLFESKLLFLYISPASRNKSTFLFELWEFKLKFLDGCFVNLLIRFTFE